MTVMHMTKNVGKPYEGKLHVRFDEGEMKVKQRPAKESLLEISSLLYIGIYKIFQSEKCITVGVSQVCKMFHASKMMSSFTG